ncbi:MAG: Lrp/AsnC ligand binding domain-containing protein [Candidatus Thorarchaeota archaeon SMTZ1-83]|nr:MAG: hypothetical protein AM324_00735 [Candidatus Thorarchaeota archaeon SMTZ1-83]
MVELHILVDTGPGEMWEAIKQIQNFKEITKAQLVMGPYDIIALARLKSINGVKRLLDEIHAVRGVTHTETCMVM